MVGSMTIEERLESILRKVVREELQVIAGDDRLLTTEQVAELLGYTDVHSVYRLKKEGKLTAVFLTEKGMRFRNSEVQQFIRELPADLAA
jgi:excisionase family DNA binding protein